MSSSRDTLTRCKNLLAATETPVKAKSTAKQLLNTLVEKLCFWLVLSTYVFPLFRGSMPGKKAS